MKFKKEIIQSVDFGDFISEALRLTPLHNPELRIVALHNYRKPNINEIASDQIVGFGNKADTNNPQTSATLPLKPAEKPSKIVPFRTRQSKSRPMLQFNQGEAGRTR